MSGRFTSRHGSGRGALRFSQETAGNRLDALRAHAWMVGAAILILLALVRQIPVVEHNLGSVATLRAALLPDVVTWQAQDWLQQAVGHGRGQANWLLGMLATWRKDDVERHDAHLALLAAHPEFIQLLMTLTPDDRDLTAATVALYPERPLALAWRAGQQLATDPAQAVDLYRRALLLDDRPYDWWLGLGKAYEAMGDDDSALIAYEEGCARAVGIIPCLEKLPLLQRMKP